MMRHHLQNMHDHLRYLIISNEQNKNAERISKEEHLPDDDASCGTFMLVDGVIVAVSESVSIHVRIAATVGFDGGLTSVLSLEFDRFKIVDAVSRVGVRRRKLTRFKND